jgi:hypothetical protein
MVISNNKKLDNKLINKNPKLKMLLEEIKTLKKQREISLEEESKISRKIAKKQKELSLSEDSYEAKIRDINKQINDFFYADLPQTSTYNIEKPLVLRRKQENH